MSKATRNMMTHAQFFKLAEWIKNNHQTSKWHQYKDVADAASKALNFPVSIYSVKNAFAGLDLQFKEQVKKFQRDRSQVIAVELVNLLKELGKEPSAALMSIVNRKGH